MPDHLSPARSRARRLPGKPMEVDAPWDGAIIATVDTAWRRTSSTTRWRPRTRSTADRDAWIPQPERIAILQRAAAIMQERREQLAIEAAREGGKPLIDSLVEVDRAIDGAQELHRLRCARRRGTASR